MCVSTGASGWVTCECSQFSDLLLGEELHYRVGMRDKEIERQGLDPKADPRHKNWDTDEIIRLTEQLKYYESVMEERCHCV